MAPVAAAVVAAMDAPRADRGGLVRPHERVDDLQRSGLVIIQNPVGFRFGMDAVFLAEFATVRDTDRVIDLGTGTGVIPLLLWARAGQEHRGRGDIGGRG